MIGVRLPPSFPDTIWGAPSIIPNGHWKQGGQRVRVTIYFNLVPRLRMSGAIPPLPILGYLLQFNSEYFAFQPNI